jgi:hypothetical protein
LLNEFGERFYANGFKLPKNHKMYKTVPVWAALSAQATKQADTGGALPISYDNTQVVAEGRIEKTDTLYFYAYSPTIKENELYGTQPFGKELAVQFGKIGLLSQFDPGLEISPSSSAFLAPMDTAVNQPSTRLGPLTPSASVLGLRSTFALGNAMPYGNGWKLAATVPFTNEIAGESGGGGPTYDLSSQPRGAFLEAYRRSGMDSVGVDYSAGRDGRHFYGLIGQKSLGRFFFEGGGGYADGFGSETRVYSFSSQWVPTFDKAFGLRVDSQNGTLSYVPTVSYIFGREAHALQMIVESAFSPASGPTTTLTAVLRF